MLGWRPTTLLEKVLVAAVNPSKYGHDCSTASLLRRLALSRGIDSGGLGSSVDTEDSIGRQRDELVRRRL